MTDLKFTIQARTPAIGELVEQCARGALGFDVLCSRVAAMGYRTTSLYEMVRATEDAIKAEAANG